MPVYDINLRNVARNFRREPDGDIECKDGIVMVTSFPGYPVNLNEEQVAAIRRIRESHGLADLSPIPWVNLRNGLKQQVAFDADCMLKRRRRNISIAQATW